MIPIKQYNNRFENQYFEVIKDKVDNALQKKIINSCKKYMPPDFFLNDKNEFQTLVLSPYNKLKEAYNYIIKNTYKTMQIECFKYANKKKPHKKYYEQFHDAYDRSSQSQRNNKKINVSIVEESRLLTCPYCNRDYINCRGEKTSGAQLDHFFSRSEFPIFSVSLYNLIPVCGNCNRVKSNSSEIFVSPFDSNIDFNKNIKFSYQLKSTSEMLIKIDGFNGLEKNIKVMKIQEAYQIHDVEINELIEKKKMYSKTQCEELQSTFTNLGIKDKDIKRAIYGDNIKFEEFGKKPLSKLRQDILKELNV